VSILVSVLVSMTKLRRIAADTEIRTRCQFKDLRRITGTKVLRKPLVFFSIMVPMGFLFWVDVLHYCSRHPVLFDNLVADDKIGIGSQKLSHRELDPF
jgi:hypothetical protein